MKLSIQQTLGIVIGGNRPGTGADCGSGRA